MMINSLLIFTLGVLFILLVLYLAWWLMSKMGLPEPMPVIVLIIILIVALVIMLNYFGAF